MSTKNTISRREFIKWYGPEPVGGWRFDQSREREAAWLVWQAGYRSANGCVPTFRIPKNISKP